MASGVYNRINITSVNTDTVLVSNTAVDAGKTSVMTINIVNTTTNPAKIRLSLASGATATQGEYLEYDTNVGPLGVIERTGVVVPRGLNVLARSDTANVNFIAYGLEG